jgi:hypothetical protein
VSDATQNPPQRIALPIRRVTLFEDRGELLRQARVDLPAGRSTLRAEGLTALMSDAHLTARLAEPVDGVHIEDVRIERVHRTPDRPSRPDDLAAELHAADRALAQAERAVAHAEHRRNAALGLMERYARQAAKTLWTPNGAPGWREGLTRLEAALESAESALVAARIERRKAAEEHEQRAAQVRQTESQVTVLTGQLSVHVFAKTPCTVEICVTGLVPCALWRPSHEARLVDDRLHWSSSATVWQNTGEDWQDVELVLSTDRPGSGATLPDLQPDTLRLQAKAHRRRVVLKHREQAVRRADDALVPGIYDGGEARMFSVAERVTVLSDGRPHRIATHHFEADVRLGLAARPEVSPHVFWLAESENRGAVPLLAGPVTLVRDGTYVGVGDLAYVAPGEPFELSFGSDDRFRLHARRTREIEERRLARDRTHFVTEVDLHYAGAERATTRVYLRMPVSEIKQLQVHPSKAYSSTWPLRPDADGLIRVPATLEPGEKITLSVGFHLESSGDVVLPDPW